MVKLKTICWCGGNYSIVGVQRCCQKDANGHPIGEWVECRCDKSNHYKRQYIRKEDINF